MRPGAVDGHSGGTLWVPSAVLRNPGDFASIVDHTDRAVVAALERWQPPHYTVLPYERQTSKAGPVQAEVFTVGIGRGAFSLADDLVPVVDAKRSTVPSAEGGWRDVQNPFFVPDDGVLRPVGDRRQTSDQATGVHEGCLAERAQRPIRQSAEVGDPILAHPGTVVLIITLCGHVNDREKYK